MQNSAKSFCRSHPVLLAALIGAIIGFAHALFVELGGALHKNHSAVILMLWPTDTFAPELSQDGILRAYLVLFIEFAGDMIGDALLFAIPVALVVVIRRAFRRRQA